jgi:hypothetical protein
MLGLDSTGEEWSMFYVFSKTAHAVGANICLPMLRLRSGLDRLR